MVREFLALSLAIRDKTGLGFMRAEQIIQG